MTVTLRVAVLVVLACSCEAFLSPAAVEHGRTSFRLAGLHSLKRPALTLPSLAPVLAMTTTSVATEVDGENIVVNTEDEDDDDVQARLIEAVQRVESLKLQLQAKEEQYQALIQSMKRDMQEREKTLQERVQDFANQLQQLRFDSHKQLMQTKQSAEQREVQLRDEIQALRGEVDKAQEDAQKAQAASQDMISKRMELEKELRLLKQQYASEMQEWEDRVEHEQDTRRKDELAALEQLEAAILDGKLQVRAERERLTIEMERLRSDMTFRLAQKDSEIGQVRRSLEQTQQDLSERELYIRDLQDERASLRKLAKISWELATSRVANRFKRIARRG